MSGDNPKGVYREDPNFRTEENLKNGYKAVGGMALLYSGAKVVEWGMNITRS